MVLIGKAFRFFLGLPSQLHKIRILVRLATMSAKASTLGRGVAAIEGVAEPDGEGCAELGEEGGEFAKV